MPVRAWAGQASCKEAWAGHVSVQGLRQLHAAHPPCCLSALPPPHNHPARLLPSVAADPSSVATSRFLLLQQKFLEGVRRGETAAALRVLRTELQPLQGVQQGVLHSLAALLLAPPGAAPAQLPAAGGGASAEELAEGRAALLDALQGDLLPSLLIPERRLEELVEQVGGLPVVLLAWRRLVGCCVGWVACGWGLQAHT